MKHNRPTRSLSFAALIAVLMAVYPASPAFAASCSGIKTAIDYSCPAGTDSVTSIVLSVVSFLAIGVGIAVVAGIVWGALRYTSANGNASQAQAGIGTIVNSVLGLVIFIFMYSILNFITPGGAFNTNPPTPAPKTATLNDGLDKIIAQAKAEKKAKANTPSSPTSPSTPSSPDANPELSGIFNFRSIGSKNMLYRSGALDKANASDISKLSTLLAEGTIIDFRTNGVRSSAPDKTIPYVSRKNMPITAPSGGNYEVFVTKSASREAFGDALNFIATSNDKVLVHCTYGKDRTGWLVAMLMYSLGASNSEVMKEYLLSNADLPDGKSVQASWLNAGLDAARSKYGSVKNYIKNGLGVSDATITKLKAKIGDV